MAQDPLLGYTLGGKYNIKRFVSEEMLGRVYYAEDAKGQAFSVKVLHPHMVDNPEVFGRFGREMLATATLEHPHTVKMIDFGEHRIFHYLVLEYITARTLQVEIQANNRLPWQRAVHIAGQICDVLSKAHSESIVHRNLCSANILLLNNTDGEGDYVKVRDFGLSRLQDDQGNADDGGLTAVGARVGTTDYMAPEYIDLATVDPRGDVYALGILLYEMMVGTPPFQGSAGQVMEMHITSPPPSPLDMTKGECPPWLDELVLAMLMKEPADRPTAFDVLQTLKQNAGFSLAPPLLTGAAPPAGASAPRPQAAEQPPAPAKKGCLPFVVLLAAAPWLALTAWNLV